MPMLTTYGLKRSEGLNSPMIITFSVPENGNEVVIRQYREVLGVREDPNMEYFLVPLDGNKEGTTVRLNVGLDKEFARRIWVSLTETGLFTEIPVQRVRRSSRSQFPKVMP